MNVFFFLFTCIHSRSPVASNCMFYGKSVLILQQVINLTNISFLRVTKYVFNVHYSCDQYFQ